MAPRAAVEAKGTQARSRGGRPPRLTQQLIEDVVASVRTGVPVNRAFEYAWVWPSVARRWRMTAAAAEAKVPRNRSQLERLCVELWSRIRQAEADAAMRFHMTAASMAGITRERPKRRRTRQRVIADAGAELVVDERGEVHGGRVIEVTIEEEELAPNATMLRALGAVRFPEQFASPPEEADGPEARQVSTDELWRALERARERAGIIIEAEVVEEQAELPAGVPDGETSVR